MRLLKWLFQPVYLLLIIVVVALYVNREAVFPEEVAESLEAEVLVAKVERLVERLRSDIDESLEVEGKADVVALDEMPNGDTTPSSVADEEGQVTVIESAPQNDVVQAQEVLSAPAQDEDVADKVAVTSMVAADSDAEEPVIALPQPAAPISVAPGMSATTVGSEPVPAPSATTDTSTAPETTAAAQPVDSDTVTEQQPTAEDEAISPLVHWRAARTAVWQGDLAGAVTHYQKLISVQPDNYDAYGEMGNVLLAQSNTQGAADAYATAATLIFRSGNRQIAYRVANIVTQLDRARGEALQGEFAR